MNEIIPAILPKNYEDMKNKIALVRGVVPLVQIDICDGIFVQSRSWPFSTGGASDFNFQAIINEQEGMPFWEDIDFELDLMVSDAVENFDIYTKLGPKRIVFHLESVGDTEEFKHFVEGIDMYVRDSIEIGVAIRLTTPVEKIFPIVNSVDFIQVMGIDHEGYQGEKFDPKCLEYIRALREKYSDLVIAVDGSVNFKTAPDIIHAGATRLVIGSAIFSTDDIIDTIQKFEQI